MLRSPIDIFGNHSQRSLPSQASKASDESDRRFCKCERILAVFTLLVLPAIELHVDALGGVVQTGVLLFFGELLRLRFPELALFHDRAVECAQFVLQLLEVLFPIRRVVLSITAKNSLVTAFLNCRSTSRCVVVAAKGCAAR